MFCPGDKVLGLRVIDHSNQWIMLARNPESFECCYILVELGHEIVCGNGFPHDTLRSALVSAWLAGTRT